MHASVDSKRRFNSGDRNRGSARGENNERGVSVEREWSLLRELE
jgi:hypothetical protein